MASPKIVQGFLYNFWSTNIQASLSLWESIKHFIVFYVLGPVSFVYLLPNMSGTGLNSLQDVEERSFKRRSLSLTHHSPF